MADSAFMGVFWGSILLVSAVAIGWLVLQVIAYWRIFSKAGEPGWKSLIPFYNTYTQYQLTWDVKWFFLLVVCVILNLFFADSEGALSFVASAATLISGAISIVSSYKLSLAFGHGMGFALGLFFLNPIFMLILGFGESQYQGPQ